MLNYIKQVIYGETSIIDHFRYECARLGVAAIHIVLLILFSAVKCFPLAIFNCFSVFFYVVLAEILIKKEKYTVAFISTYFEIVIHSAFACIILGQSFGFSLYNIGLIYVAYYFAYISPSSKRKLLLPTILGLINLALTLCIRICNYYFEPILTDYPREFSFTLWLFNFSVAAIMIMFFAALHSIEIQRKAYELQKTNARLDKLAHYDALTKLRNRHSMEEHLRSILKNQLDGDYCFIMGDIDDFKQFNDTYGHACGDYVLQSVADVILKNVDSDETACRWGGEEILILLKANLEYAGIIAEKIRYEIDHMDAVFHDIPLHVTMTFGVAAYNPKSSFEKCISTADKRLYAGKRQSKNCVISKDT